MKKLTKKITALLAAVMSACLPAAFADVPTGYVKSSYNILYQKLPTEYTEGATTTDQLPIWTDGDNEKGGVLGNTEYATFDLGAEMYLADLECVYMKRTGNYTISVSKDNSNWTNVTTYSCSDEENDASKATTNSIEINDSYRYIKISRNSKYVIGIYELIVHDLFDVPDGTIKSSKSALSGILATNDCEGDQAGGQGVENMTDDDLSTKKQTGLQKLTYIQFDMGEVKPIAEIDIYRREDGYGGTFTLSVSEDGTNWTNIYTYKNVSNNNNYKNEGPIAIDRNCRYIKLTRTDGRGNLVVYEFQAFAYVPGYEIKSVTASPAENENVEVTLNKAFTGTDTDGLFTVTDKATKETVASKVESVSGNKIEVSFDEYLTAGETYEIAFSEAAVEKYGENGMFLADGKKEFTVKKKAVSQAYDKDDGELTVSTESTADVTVYAFLMHFDENGKLISAGFETKTGTASSTNAATISVSKATGADKSYAVIFTYDAGSQRYTPMGKIEID